MRAKEFQTVPAEKILDYVKRTQGDKHFHMDHLITDHPNWRLTQIPLKKLRIPSTDLEQDDPYNRVLDTNTDYADLLAPEDIKRRPIVVDRRGVIIDGNHRAYRAYKLGWQDIPAYVPAFISESIVGTLNKHGIEIAVNSHAIDQAVKRQVLPSDIDRVLKKIPLVQDSLNQISGNQKFWIYDLKLDVAVGFQKSDTNKFKYYLNTVVGDRPYDSNVLVINV
jgi:hypothetical protein